MTNRAAPSGRTAAGESGFGVRILDARGAVQARVIAVLAVLVPVGTRPAFPAVNAATNKVSHQIDAGAIVAARIAGAVVHIYCVRKKQNRDNVQIKHLVCFNWFKFLFFF